MFHRVCCCTLRWWLEIFSFSFHTSKASSSATMSDDLLPTASHLRLVFSSLPNFAMTVPPKLEVSLFKLLVQIARDEKSEPCHSEWAFLLLDILCLPSEGDAYPVAKILELLETIFSLPPLPRERSIWADIRGRPSASSQYRNDNVWIPLGETIQSKLSRLAISALHPNLSTPRKG